MRILLYEWSCSGGLRGPSAAAVVGEDGILPGDGPFQVAAATVPVEGRAMLEALLADGVRRQGWKLAVLVDRSLSIDEPAGVQQIDVDGATEIEALVRAASSADWTVIVAPETAGVLGARVAAVREVGGRVAAPSAGFIATAADKQATVLALAAAGVPVPAGRVLQAFEVLPEGFYLPAVSKARGGVGCDGVTILRGARDFKPDDHDRRLEAFVPGVPVGVSLLCGPEGHLLLPPVQQEFTPGDRPRYLGGVVRPHPSWSHRAVALAQRAVAALEGPSSSAPAAHRALGWVGVDMILGSADDGGADRVLEVNPRLTTSFVGLSRLTRESLLGAMLDCCDGRSVCQSPGLMFSAGAAFAGRGSQRGGWSFRADGW